MTEFKGKLDYIARVERENLRVYNDTGTLKCKEGKTRYGDLGL